MKKIFVPIVLLIFLGVIMYVFFANAKDNTLTLEKALEVGEEKYLKFLWMVDGAFNNTLNDQDYLVNNKKLSSEEKIFKCEYQEKKDTYCIGKNFDTEFSKLFSKKINYDSVYTDGIMNSRYVYENGNYFFNNMSNCNTNRMPLNQQLKVMNIKNNELLYKVLFTNQQNGNLEERDFSLVFEDNEWKINIAFYHDSCDYRYYIY